MEKVKVGQTWRDNDRRCRDRKIFVENIVGDVAFCRSGSRTGRRTTIKLSRFRQNATGYILVTDENKKL